MACACKSYVCPYYYKENVSQWTLCIGLTYLFFNINLIVCIIELIFIDELIYKIRLR